MTLRDEFGLIHHLVSRLPKSVQEGPGIRVGIGDDTAVLREVTGEEWLVTTDSIVEQVHFTAQTMGWRDVGYKAVAVSVSDIAAMGGTPRYVLIALILPKGHEGLADEHLEELYDGIGECCNAYNCQVVGGNVASAAGPVSITSTVLGTVPTGKALLRSGAEPGDIVFVTGPVGSSAAGLRQLLQPRTLPGDEVVVLMRAHQRPVPQVMAGRVLCEVGASSCNDISDGLASELNEIAKASHVRLRISRERIPMIPELRNFARTEGSNPLEYAFYGGEDYQLVGTASPFIFARALSRLQAMGIPLTQIGRVEAGDGVIAEGGGQGLEVIEAKGYNHLNSGP